jgi:spore coat polysaccharide biosynthesis predicted glycosyltransferase SpsG
MYDSLRALNHSGLPLQLVVVAGRDDHLYRRLQGTEWHVETHLYNFVTDMATLMQAADLHTLRAAPPDYKSGGSGRCE